MDAIEIKNDAMAEKLDETTQELMIITMEECGELIQACSKYIRFRTNEDGIKQEAGDIYAMLEMMVKHKLLDWKDIYNQAEIKKKKLSHYSSLI